MNPYPAGACVVLLQRRTCRSSRDATVQPVCLFARRVESQVVEPASLEHRDLVLHFHPGHLEGVRDCCWPKLNERVTQPIFLQVTGHPCVEDARIEGDQAIEISGERGQVTDAVEQGHARRLVSCCFVQPFPSWEMTVGCRIMTPSAPDKCREDEIGRESDFGKRRGAVDALEGAARASIAEVSLPPYPHLRSTQDQGVGCS